MELFEILQLIGLFIGLLITLPITLYNFWVVYIKDKPILDCDIIDKSLENGVLFLRFAFQNRGRRMSSATEYYLRSYNGGNYRGKQVYDEINSLIQKGGKSVLTYPTDLHPGQAIHLTVGFETGNVDISNAEAEIKFIDGESKVLPIYI